MTAPLPLPAWGAGSWVNCTYWPQALRDNPEEETPDRVFGKCAHVVAANLQRGVAVHAGEPVAGFPGQFVTDEMLDCALMYLRDVQEHSKGQPIYVEQVLQAQGRLAPVGIVKPDTFCWVDSNTLVLWELKTGRRFISAFSNWQMLVYISTILDQWKVSGLRDQQITVKIRVIQPRNFDREGHCREWTITAAELRPLFNILGNAAEEAMGPNATARTGISQCRKCPGRGKCSTFQRHAYMDASLAGDGAPFAMDGPALGLELRTLQDARDILEARITGLEVEARAMIQRGHEVRGFTTERSSGRQVWSVPDDQVAMLGQMFGTELTRSKPVTPKQAIDAGVPADVVNQYSDRFRSEAKLIRIENSQVRKAFGITKE
jgi:hypothetical protein